MTKTHIALAILVTGFLMANLSGCSTFWPSASKIKADWLGHQIRETVIQWGGPDSVTEIGQDKAYTWKSCNAQGGWCCFQTFVVDSNGIIVDYNDKGGCRP